MLHIFTRSLALICMWLSAHAQETKSDRRSFISDFNAYPTLNYGSSAYNGLATNFNHNYNYGGLASLGGLGGVYPSTQLEGGFQPMLPSTVTPSYSSHNYPTAGGLNSYAAGGGGFSNYGALPSTFSTLSNSFNRLPSYGGYGLGGFNGYNVGFAGFGLARPLSGLHTNVIAAAIGENSATGLGAFGAGGFGGYAGGNTGYNTASLGAPHFGSGSHTYAGYGVRSPFK